MFTNTNVNLMEAMMFENHRRLQEEAAHERLVRAALQSGSPRRGFHCRLLATLGNGLMALGCRLWERYGDTITTPLAMPCEE